jgi:zinc protease
MPVLLKGSKWAERDIIGDLDIIRNCTYKTIRDFYHDWYRTDLQAISIIGDIDVDAIEAKVKKMFTKIPAIKNPRPRPVHEIPAHKEMYYVLATDKEAQSSDVKMVIIHKESKDKDLASIRDQYMSRMYNMMFGARINELMQKGENACVYGGSYYGGMLRGYEAFNILASAKPNQEAKAFKLIYTEIERVKRHGFLASELDRAKADYLTKIESSFKEKDKISNDTYARTISNDYLQGDVATDPTFDFQFGNFAIQSISLEDINALAPKWLTKENRVVIVSGPSESVKHATEAEIKQVIADVEASTIAAYEDNTSGKSLVEEGSIKGGKTVSTKELPDFAATEWTLSNGAKVIFRQADYEKDQVTLKAWSKGGSSIYENKDMVSTKCLSFFAGIYGVGDFDATTLRKLLAGKTAYVYPYLNSLEEGFNGACTPKDFETMLQLLYLNFEKPRFDQSAHDAVVSRVAAQIKASEGNPLQIKNDSITRIFTNYNPRIKLENADFIKEINMKRMEEIYKDRFTDASDFTFMIVGNIAKEDAKVLVEKYIGSLTDKNRTEKWIDRKVSSAKGLTEKILYFPMETEKGTVHVKMFNDMKYNTYNKLCITIIKDILRARYTEEIREKEGGTYGVKLRTEFTKFPREEASLYFEFDCDPLRANHLKALCYKEMDKIVKNGPTDKDFNDIVLNIKKNREQSKLHNKYWSNALRSLYYYGENTIDKANYEDILDNLSKKDIKKAAKKFFKRINKVDLTMLPKK